MTTQLQTPGLEADLVKSLVGKTIRGVRPTHDRGPVPDVNVLFTDDTAITLSVKPGVYFEGCLINTLRKAQPITEVIVRADGGGDHSLEIRSRTFPLMLLLAVNKELALDECPFEFTWREKHGA